MSRRVAVYGGSFNPFSSHHSNLIRWLAVEGKYDVVIVSVAAAHALKDGLLEYVHRHNMAELGVSYLRDYLLPNTFKGEIRVPHIEKNMMKDQPPHIHLRAFTGGGEDFQEEDTIQFAIGPDIPEELHRWANVEDIKREFGFISLPAQPMRATQIRENIQGGYKDWVSHVPPPVCKYLEMHEIYRGDSK